MFHLWGTSLHNQAIPTGILSNKLLLAKSFLYQPHYNALSSSECLHNSHLKKNKNKTTTHKQKTPSLSHPLPNRENPWKINIGIQINTKQVITPLQPKKKQ